MQDCRKLCIIGQYIVILSLWMTTFLAIYHHRLCIFLTNFVNFSACGCIIILHYATLYSKWSRPQFCILFQNDTYNMAIFYVDDKVARDEKIMHNVAVQVDWVNFHTFFLYSFLFSSIITIFFTCFEFRWKIDPLLHHVYCHPSERVHACILRAGTVCFMFSLFYPARLYPNSLNCLTATWHWV